MRSRFHIPTNCRGKPVPLQSSARVSANRCQQSDSQFFRRWIPKVELLVHISVRRRPDLPSIVARGHTRLSRLSPSRYLGEPTCNWKKFSSIGGFLVGELRTLWTLVDEKEEGRLPPGWRMPCIYSRADYREERLAVLVHPCVKRRALKSDWYQTVPSLPYERMSEGSASVATNIA